MHATPPKSEDVLLCTQTIWLWLNSKSRRISFHLGHNERTLAASQKKSQKNSLKTCFSAAFAATGDMFPHTVRQIKTHGGSDPPHTPLRHTHTHTPMDWTEYHSPLPGKKSTTSLFRSSAPARIMYAFRLQCDPHRGHLQYQYFKKTLSGQGTKM